MTLVCSPSSFAQDTVLLSWSLLSAPLRRTIGSLVVPLITSVVGPRVVVNVAVVETVGLLTVAEVRARIVN